MDYEYWCGLSDEELARQDVAAMNLACAEGLPGSEELDAKNSLACLEQWTEKAREGRTRALRNRPHFEKEFAHLNDAEYLIVSLYAILYRHIKLVPNLDCQDDTKPYDGRDSRDSFIHAVLTDLHPHTCCTVPVIFAAIGRRLGYPIKLVKSKQHIFCRWDEPGGERFNIEATDQDYYRKGDDYYRQWPFPSDPQSVLLGGWLLSLTPRRDEGPGGQASQRTGGGEQAAQGDRG